LEAYVELVAFFHFLNHNGSLLPRDSVPFVTDEEYLAGACMGVAQTLQRYGMGRATDRDFESVNAAKRLVETINLVVLVVGRNAVEQTAST